jgi:hypothetical protein
VFPVRYILNFYILFRRNSVFKGLKVDTLKAKAASSSKTLINIYQTTQCHNPEDNNMCLT